MYKIPRLATLARDDSESILKQRELARDDRYRLFMQLFKFFHAVNEGLNALNRTGVVD